MIFVSVSPASSSRSRAAIARAPRSPESIRIAFRHAPVSAWARIARRTPSAVSYVSTSSVAPPGRARSWSAKTRVSPARPRAMTLAWAIVPVAGMPRSRAAAVVAVPAKPARYAARAAPCAAPRPSRRRIEKSHTGRPAAARTICVAFVAIRTG